MKVKYLCTVLMVLFAALASEQSRAQATFTEDFTGASSANQWYFFNGACLTAGTSTSTSNPGYLPACTTVLNSYYATAQNADPALTGGNSGYLGASTAPASRAAQVPDPVGSGALRFTNGAPYGHQERGAILSTDTFSTGAGIQVTFKTVTYHGDSGGAGGDGADGISFFLMDGSKPAGLGATGGSLAYSCSNNNPNYDGVNGGYIGLGIDEYGNFLNGANLVPGYTGTNVVQGPYGDNAAYGYGYKPGRIGMRGAGSISFAALSAASPAGYGTNPSNSVLPYYPATLATSCTIAGGVYSSTTNNCIDICNAAGSSYDPTTNVCNRACATGSTYDPTTDTCQSCPTSNGGGNYNPGNNTCINTTKCATGTTYYSTTNTCDSCPATSYATGTYNNGQCINSCPTGYSNPTTTTCMPVGSVYNAGYYCPSGDLAPTLYSGTYYCYNSTLSHGSGDYCPSGQTIIGTHCYPTGDQENATTLKYCPSGNTIDSTGNYCYPTASPAYSTSGAYYCTTGLTITGTSCYPSGDQKNTTTLKYCPSGQSIDTTGNYCYPNGSSISGTNYCPSGQLITGTHCYPTGDQKNTTTLKYCASGQTIDTSGAYCYPTASPANVFGAGYYCPNGDTAPTAAAECCPSPYTYSVLTGKCSNGTVPTAATAASAAIAMPVATAMTGATTMAAATAMIAATPMPAATAAPAATAVTAAQSITPNQSATLITSPTATPPSTYTPGTGNTDALYAVQNTCKTGILYNYSTPTAPTSAGPATLANSANTAGILDYAPIPNAYKELTSFQIANESATTRSAATPIFYNLKITQNGLLSLSYSTGGAYSSLINAQSITASNGTLPASFRVGFAGSTGGDTNVHEIMCFKAAAATQSGSSASVNEKQAAKIEAGTQAYFAYYNPDDWTGSVTANTLIDTGGVVTISSTANWDASCQLSGTAAGATSTGGGCTATGVSGPTSATPVPASRIMLTWDTANGIGIPFEWTNLNAAQQAALTAGDATSTPNRLNYLRGDRSNEINSAGAGLYRARDAILGDIVDSSPSWVGPPSSPYTAVWQDRLYPTAVMPENSGSQSYVQFVSTEQTRTNVVYVGSNDGFLHGFRAGSFDSTGAYVSTNNDGLEVLAYMPGSTLVSAATSTATGGCTYDVTTGTVVQQIHGVTPAIGTNPLCVEPLLDYSNTQYGHNFFVDATPGTGDLYYNGQWHTWLVGGLGAGGAAIYALDITNPDTGFNEGNASNIVIGEWNPSSISCALVSNCGTNLGNTYGTPQIHRLHNGNWGAVFGNGLGSQSGDAGIYVMSVDIGTGTTTFYYLSTGTAGANGITYAWPADLDGDHISDYVYAGDVNGNLWRFDLTSNDPSYWGVTNAAGISVNALSGGGGPGTPLFTTQSGQPITTQVLVLSTIVTGTPRLLIEFGTGSRTQLTNLTPVQYSSGTQSLYGVWDWNLSNWNTLAPAFAYTSLAASASTTGLVSPYLLSSGNLTAQTLTQNTNGTVDGTNVTICWQGSTTCGSGNTSFGWYANLPGSSEQIIYNPVYYQGGILVNSVVPANNLPTSCTNTSDSGYTYALNIVNGGVFANTFPTYTNNGVLIVDAQEAAVETNAAGSVAIVNTAENILNIVYSYLSPGNGGPGGPGGSGNSPGGHQTVHLPPNTKAKRLSWVEMR